MMKTAIIFSLALALKSVSAHTIFQELYLNGVSQGHMNAIRVVNINSPIMDVTSPDLACNSASNQFRQPMSTTVVSTPAGSTITAEWHHTLSGSNSSDIEDPIAASHHGPVLAYLAKVPSATQQSTSGLKWFKIWQDGYTSDGKWGVDRMYANKGKVTFNIPTCVAAGQYLLRVEIIALHSAYNYPGAQFYMECAQLAITGSGSASPATVSLPGAYAATDPGIKLNIYDPISSYTVPGPAVFSC